YVALGPVYTVPYFYENGYLSLRLHLSFTCSLHFSQRKLRFSKTASKVKVFKNIRFYGHV
ncbi:hypothetical protein P7M41_25975, partial [Vibrio parahaemolyticus]|nr:hypothetical protein [Vibrio parahaemolyticus]